MVRFLDLLKRADINVPFVEALKEAPSYLKFFEGAKMGELHRTLVAPIGEVYRAVS